MTDTEPRSSPRSPLLGYSLLGASIALAAVVVVFLALRTGDDDAPAPAPAITPFPSSVGAPTPVPNTGMIDPNRPREGERAPDFALPDVRDPARVRRLSEFRGTPVVLNFWATWCGPCKAEIPEFQAAQDALGDRVVFLGVNYRESPERAAAFLTELNATFPSLVDGGGKVAEHYRVSGLPVTYFLDRDGVVVHIEIGAVSVEELERYLTASGVPYDAAN